LLCTHRKLPVPSRGVQGLPHWWTIRKNLTMHTSENVFGFNFNFLPERVGSSTSNLQNCLHCFEWRRAPEASVVVEHLGRGVVEDGGRCAHEGACERASLQLVVVGLGLRRAPFPGVAAHVVDAVRADAAVVAVDGG